jgi:hypothetical protein
LEYNGNNHTNNRVYTPIIGKQNGDDHHQIIWGYSLLETHRDMTQLDRGYLDVI